MKLLFFGTPEFAVPTLEACLAAGHTVAAVYTQPDRPRGRGHEIALSPVKAASIRRGLPVEQPLKIRQPEVIESVRAYAADAIIVVGYGQIIPQAIIDQPRFGVLNVHASLLPKYRGAAPIQRAIANGETVTGVTTMKIDAGLDTGDILLAESLEIDEDETAVQLSARLAALGAKLLIRTLAGLEDGGLTPRAQDHSAATLAPILRKEEGLIDWKMPARTIFNRARGFQPWPGAYTTFRDRTLHVFSCRPSDEVLIGEPGSVAARRKRLFVSCGQMTTLELLEVQLEGRRRAAAVDFLNGQRISDNEKLGATENG